MKIIDRNDPINLIGGIYTKNIPNNGDEMVVEIVGILEHRELHKDRIVNYFILNVLTSTAGFYMNTLYNYISGPYHRNTLLNFKGPINNKYYFEICDKFLHDYTKKNDLNK